MEFSEAQVAAAFAVDESRFLPSMGTAARATSGPVTVLSSHDNKGRALISPAVRQSCRDEVGEPTLCDVGVAALCCARPVGADSVPVRVRFRTDCFYQRRR